MFTLLYQGRRFSAINLSERNYQTFAFGWITIFGESGNSPTKKRWGGGPKLSLVRTKTGPVPINLRKDQYSLLLVPI